MCLRTKTFQSIFFSIVCLFLISCGQRSGLIINPPPIPLKVENLDLHQRGDVLIVKFNFPAKLLDGNPLLKVDELFIEIEGKDRDKSKKEKPEIRVKSIKKINLKESREFKEKFKICEDKIYTVQVYYRVSKYTSEPSRKSFITVKLPLPPEIMSSGYDEKKIYIKLKVDKKFSEYRIYRKESDKKIEMIKSTLLDDYDDGEAVELFIYDFEWEKEHLFYATGVLKENRGYETSFSRGVRIFTKDIYPPSSPKNLKYYLISKKVILKWDKVKVDDLLGYIMYYKDSRSMEFVRYNREPIVKSEVEVELKEGKYTFFVLAVDLRENESKPSNKVSFELN